MELHHFHPDTREYAGTTQAREDPKVPGRFLQPANSTPKAPPATAEREAAVFDPAADAWRVVSDWRGVAWWAYADGTEHAIEALGEEPPADALLTDPGPQPDAFHVWQDGGWVYSLEREREQMIATAWQARAALLAAGLLDDVEALLADPSTARDIKLMWQHKPTIRRTHQTTIDMARALGMTDTQLDDLFRAAVQLD